VRNRARFDLLRDAIGPTHAAEWPTCIRCTDDTALAGKAFEHWIPVQGYRVEPAVFRKVALVSGGVGNRQAVEVADLLNPPRQRNTRGWFTVIAECHGKETSAEIDVPTHWGVAHVRAAIQSLKFFGQDTKPAHELRPVGR
jgi:hypothetical protein